MNRLGKLKKAVLAGIALCTFSFTTAFAMPPLMTFNEVQPGMTGTAYTVVDLSGELKPMDVSIVGAMGANKAKGSSKRILVKVSGPVVEKAGGVLSGMSGSPVYVNGKLVGAISATVKETSPYNAIITPIEEMVALWNMPDKLNKTRFEQVDLTKALIKKAKDQSEFEKKFNEAEHKLAKIAGLEVEEAKEDNKKNDKKDDVKKENKSEQKEEAEQKDLAAENKEKTELTTDDKMIFHAGGFSGRDFDFLQEKLHQAGISVKEASGWNIAGSHKVLTNASLQPGSAVGVAAVVGDFSLGAVGTVTAVDGKKMVGFGHSFVHRGNSNFFMTDAKIIGTVSGPVNGMKLGESTNLIGRINQDRESGIAGILGTFPQSVPIIVNVKDKDLGTNITYNSAIAYDEKLLPELTSSVAYAAISKSIDRLSGSTADFKFTIRTNAAKDGKMERRNMFYNPADVGKTAVEEMSTILSMICTDKEKESNILDIKVDVAVDSNRCTATLVSATPSKPKVEPGETVNLKVVIKPYRKSKETINIPYKVPALAEPGPMALDLHGGGLVSVAQLMLMQQQAAAIEATENGDKEESLQNKISSATESYMNNEIIVEPATVVPTSDAEQKAAIKKAIKQSKKLEKLTKEGKIKQEDVQQQPISRFTTNYIIENVVRTTLQVVKPSGKK